MPSAQTGGAEFPLMANLLQLMMGPQSDAPTVPTAAPGTAGTVPTTPAVSGANAPRGRQASSADVLRALDWGDLQGGDRGGAGNPSGGVAGSQNPSGGVLGGLLGGDFGNLSGVDVLGSVLGSAVGQVMGGVPAGALTGIIGTMAQQGLLGPSFGNVAGPNATAADVLGSLKSGAIAASDAAFADPGPTAQARAAAAIAAFDAAANAFGSNPGIKGSTGYTAAQSTAATSDTSAPATGADLGPGQGLAGPGGWGSTSADPSRDVIGESRDPSGGGGTGGGEGLGGGDVGGGCFDEATPILMADGTTKPIRDIRPGDLVASFVELGPIIAAKVVAISTNGEWLPTLDIDGLKVTPRHRFMTTVREWLRAERFDVGTVLVRADASEYRVASISDGGFRRVFNFEVEGTHTYIAGGLRVHNSKANAKGGPVKGPAPKEKNKDNVEITAQGGEHVMSRAAVKMVGRKKLDQINQIAELREKAVDFMKLAKKAGLLPQAKAA